MALIVLLSVGCGARTEPLVGEPDAAVVTRDAAVADTTTPDGATCGDASVSWIRERFEDCGDEGRVGQSANAPGTTCSAVCCALGYPGCSYRAAQSDFVACNIEEPARTGTCSDIFAEGWSSQCICETEESMGVCFGEAEVTMEISPGGGCDTALVPGRGVAGPLGPPMGTRIRLRRQGLGWEEARLEAVVRECASDGQIRLWQVSSRDSDCDNAMSWAPDCPSPVEWRRNWRWFGDDRNEAELYLAGEDALVELRLCEGGV
jgi:hypothetical protein